MSAIIGSPLLLGGDATTPSYTTQRSVRLRSSATAYFSRTFGTPTNNTVWTFSSWVKRGLLSTNQTIMGGSTFAMFGFRGADDLLHIWNNAGASTDSPVGVRRDPSAWCNICYVSNGTTITGYFNNTQFVSWTGTITNFNSAGTHYIGRDSSGDYFDGYLTEINFIDGQALTPSSFGEYDSVRNTQWKPKAYTGTYGTNGFYLNFADNSAATAAALGKDSSGNGNNWTPTNISLTAGVTYDSMTDVPTLTSETASNFAVLNPLSIMGSGNTLTNGNLTFAGNGSSNIITTGTFGMSSGKWYVEATITNGSGGVGFGIAKDIEPRGSATVGNTANSWGYNGVNGAIANNSSTLSTGATYTTNDVVAFALDMDAGTLTFYKNNTAQGSTVTGLSGTFLVAVSGYLSTINLNFGQRPFTYTPPSGFKALNTFNIPDGAVPSSDDYHKVYTYTGNGGGLQVGEIQKPLSLFNLDRSLRFRASATGYLSRTATVPTSAYIWTTSAWIKLGSNPSGGTFTILGAGNTTPNWLYNYINSADGTFQFYAPNTGATVNLISSNVFKDPLLWYHVVIAVDTTQATPSNRIKIYVNNVQLTFTGTITYPAQNATFFWNQNGVVQRIGSITGAGSFDGYMADFYGIDGQQLTPDSFGQYDGNYYWTPKAYSGTYGAQGFHLEFEDFSAATAAAIGKDTSGQGNNWTPNNINLTTPANTNASWDSMVDVPTLTSADVANFCTLNPLRSFVSGSAATFTDGNLAVSIPAVLNPPRNVTSTYDVSSGKWYWEVIAGTVASNFVIGIASKAMDFNATIFVAGSYLYDATNGNKYIGGTASAYGSSYTTNDVIGIALDMDAGTLTFYKNGVSQGVAATGLQGLTVTPVIAASGSSAITGTFNFGQRPFKYSNYGTDRPAATFKPINSFNIAEVAGDLESPDFVWIKSRSAGTNHASFNSVTGVGKYLSSNLAAAEVTDVNSLIQFNKNGFLIGNSAVLNTLSATYVAAAWKTGGSVVTNNAGSISSQVRANATSGISIITYNGTAANATVGHGLGVTPAVIMVKPRVNATPNWRVWHQSLGTTDSYLGLNQTALVATSTSVFNSQSPTTFGIGTDPATNSASAMLAICFAEVPGFSKFTSYLANASATDGPHVVCGFSPRWLMIKRATGASGTGGWIMYDTARSTYNTMSEYLFAESPAGFGTLAAIDVTANGFKIRSNNVHLNQTAGDKYIVMAFAEHPFKYALAR